MRLPPHPALRDLWRRAAAAGRAAAALHESAQRIRGLSVALDHLPLLHAHESLAGLLQSSVDGAVARTLERIPASASQVDEPAARPRAVQWPGSPVPHRETGQPAQAAASGKARQDLPSTATTRVARSRFPNRPPSLPRSRTDGTLGQNLASARRAPEVPDLSREKAAELWEHHTRAAGLSRAWNGQIKIDDLKPHSSPVVPISAAPAAVGVTLHDRLTRIVERIEHTAADRPVAAAPDLASVHRRATASENARREIPAEPSHVTAPVVRAQSGLRALAALSHARQPFPSGPARLRATTSEPVPAPESALAAEARPVPPAIPLRSDDLAAPVEELLRREAARHGIIPEEWDR